MLNLSSYQSKDDHDEKFPEERRISDEDKVEKETGDKDLNKSGNGGQSSPWNTHVRSGAGGGAPITSIYPSGGINQHHDNEKDVISHHHHDHTNEIDFVSENRPINPWKQDYDPFWREWFVLPHLQNPELDSTFCVYSVINRP